MSRNEVDVSKAVNLTVHPSDPKMLQYWKLESAHRKPHVPGTITPNEKRQYLITKVDHALSQFDVAGNQSQ
ncbi:hypothetical protein H2198_005414 [Neophaeococcomyces mojaviensis]|uniref:Uncharacterized protein n=1 Tax=Neophaeococcomyces mojaviensis TaxID=3383035 RepID=A0ACC3A600_9EURO|nr:hypothetical protein H2198_005414 [Knufia sp. JES_112]